RCGGSGGAHRAATTTHRDGVRSVPVPPEDTLVGLGLPIATLVPSAPLRDMGPRRPRCLPWSVLEPSPALGLPFRGGPGGRSARSSPPGTLPAPLAPATR